MVPKEQHSIEEDPSTVEEEPMTVEDKHQNCSLQ